MTRLQCDCVPSQLGNYPLMKITMGGGIVFDFIPDYYMVPDDLNLPQSVSQKCNLTFVPLVAGVKSQWVLGNPFLRAYFSIFDLSEDAQRIGLVGGSLPVERLEVSTLFAVTDWGHNVWWIMVITLIIIFLFIICACLIVRSFCQRRIILRLEKPVESEESDDETQPVDVSIIQIVEPKK